MEAQLDKTQRQFDIDWIRIGLIFSVFLFHIGMVFNGWTWHIKNEPAQVWLHPVMDFLHAWRMPLLFLVSGVGTRYALGKRTIGGFVKERGQRLLLPFVGGVFILVPLQVYIEKISDYSSLGNFYMHLFEGAYPEGNFSWHHLWFILYLFLISVFFVPFLKFYRSKYFGVFEARLLHFCKTPGAAVLLAVPIILSQLLLLPFFPNETKALYNDWAYFSLYFIYFFYGFVLVGNAEIMEIIVRDRFVSLGVSLLAILVTQKSGTWFPGADAKFIYHYSALVMGWSLSLTILGFSRKCLNVESHWRKPLNQAIYPVYLLHQPIIIMVAYYVVGLVIPVWSKALIILVGSAAMVFLTIRFLILPFNFLRLIFGLKSKRKQEVLFPNSIILWSRLKLKRRV